VIGAPSSASLDDVTPRRVLPALARKLLMPGMITGLLLVAACGSNDDSAIPAANASPTTAPAVPADPGDDSSPAGTGTGVDDPSPTPAEPEPTLPGEPTPTILEFTAPLVGGGQFDGASLAGTPVLFWFWAPF
jgi:hypothetical protein